MKKIEAIVRQEKYIDLQEALNEIDVHGITVYQVMGCGHQKGYTNVVRGNKVEINMLPKVKFEIVDVYKRQGYPLPKYQLPEFAGCFHRLPRSYWF